MDPASGPQDSPRSPTATMRRDVLSAYAASGAKVLSWVIVSAVVFRASPLQYALLALIRGTIGLLNYTTLGLAPAIIRLVAEGRAAPAVPLPVVRPDAASPGDTAPPAPVLTYATPRSARHSKWELVANPERVAFVNGGVVAILAGMLGMFLSAAYALFFEDVHRVPPQAASAQGVAFLMAVGVVFRVSSEAPSAVLQAGGRIATDNVLVVLTEAVWVIAFVGLLLLGDLDSLEVNDAAVAFLFSGLFLLLVRAAAANLGAPGKGHDARLIDFSVVGRLIAFGALVTVAQLADFLYAPTDYILINRLISPEAVAYYAPAVQIDAGLLLLVTGLAAVLLPKSASAHAAGDTATLRRYYLRGTLASAALLAVAGVAVYLFSPQIFRLWLGDPLPQTQAILPLVLVHTVVGGSAGVGRSILLGMGKVKPFAAAALVAGAANVVLSYVFVKYFNLGLKGIVYGTIVAVVGRAVLWQPWYVLRTLRREAGKAFEARAVAAAPPEPL